MEDKNFTGLEEALNHAIEASKIMSAIKEQYNDAPLSPSITEAKSQIFVGILRTVENLRQHYMETFGDLDPDFRKDYQKIMTLIAGLFESPLNCRHFYAEVGNVQLCVNCGCYRHLNQKEAQC